MLKKYAFGPIQKTIDERRDRIRAGARGGRQRPRRGARAARAAPRADRAGAAPRRRRSSPRRAQVADAQLERAQARRPRPSGSAGSRRRASRSRPRPRARSSRSAREVADLTLSATREGRRQGARRRRPAAPDRGGDRRARLLRAREGANETDGRRSPHVRAAALRGRARSRAASTSVARAARRVRRRRSTRCPSCAASSRNPQLDPRAKARALEEVLDGADELVRNFLRLSPRRAAPAELDGIAERVRARSSTASEGRLDGRADDRLRALRRRGAGDRRADRAGVRPHGRGHPHGRPRPDRRHRPPGRLAARRRERARPARPPPPRTRHPELKEHT